MPFYLNPTLTDYLYKRKINKQKIKNKAIASALGAVVIGSPASLSVQVNTSLLSVNTLDSGCTQSAKEGKCGGQA
jgi:hypothetical protein